MINITRIIQPEFSSNEHDTIHNIRERNTADTAYSSSYMDEYQQVCVIYAQPHTPRVHNYIDGCSIRKHVVFIAYQNQQQCKQVS